MACRSRRAGTHQVFCGKWRGRMRRGRHVTGAESRGQRRASRRRCTAAEMALASRVSRCVCLIATEIREPKSMPVDGQVRRDR